MRQKSKPIPIGDILAQWQPNPAYKQKMAQYAIWEEWEKIVGPEFARQAKPHKWEGEILVVHVRHSTWLQELKLREPQILETLLRKCPQLGIKKILWKIGALD